MEKSRVTSLLKNERNFHVFYQILNGADESLINELELERDNTTYNYLRNIFDQENEAENSSINDADNFTLLKSALNSCDFSEQNKIVKSI